MSERDQDVAAFRLAKRRLTTRINAHRTSLSRGGQTCGERDLEGYVNRARESIALPILPSLNLLASDLGAVGFVHAARGLLDVADGNESASMNLSTSVELLKWAVRLECRFHFNLPPEVQPSFASQFTLTVTSGTLLLAYFVLRGDLAGADELFRYLSASGIRLGDSISKFWLLRQFEPAFVYLYSKCHGLPCPFNIDDIDLVEYAPLLRDWENDRRCSESLVSLCDYHLSRLDSSRKWDAEFRLTPFDLFPVEIHAFNILRERMGLGRVEVPHLLMQFCPVWIPTPISPEVAPLIEATIEKMGRMTPSDGL